MMKSQRWTLWTVLAVLTLGLAGCRPEGVASCRMTLAQMSAHTAFAVLRCQRRFSIFRHAIEKAGLAYTLAMPGDYTIFAPTNAAFNRVPYATLQKLAQRRNRQALRNLLWYHITLFRLTPAMARQAPNQIMGNQGKARIVSNGKTFLSIDKAKIVGRPIITRNAVIYPIDGVLFPAVPEPAPAPTPISKTSHSGTMRR